MMTHRLRCCVLRWLALAVATVGCGCASVESGQPRAANERQSTYVPSDYGRRTIELRHTVDQLAARIDREDLVQKLLLQQAYAVIEPDPRRIMAEAIDRLMEKGVDFGPAAREAVQIQMQAMAVPDDRALRLVEIIARINERKRLNETAEPHP